MGYIGTPYRVVYESKDFVSGLLDVAGAVIKPNGVRVGPYPLSEMLAPFQGRYYFDFMTSGSDPAGEYFALVVSPSEQIQDTKRISLYVDPSAVVQAAADQITAASDAILASVATIEAELAAMTIAVNNVVASVDDRTVADSMITIETDGGPSLEPVLQDRVTIPVGADVVLYFRFMNTKTQKQLDLTNMIRAQMFLTARDKSTMDFENVAKPAGASHGKYAGVTYTAVTAAMAGNLIVLYFDGVKTIAQVMSTWNLANPTNTVTCDAANTAVVPALGELHLEHGYDAYDQISVFGNPLYGVLALRLKQVDTLNLRIGINQSLKCYIDFSGGGPRKVATLQNAVDII